MLGRWLDRLVAFGTEAYPPDVQRRLKILNVIAYLIAIATLAYALQHAFVDFETWAPIVIINLSLVVAALAIPFAHRIHEIAGGLLLVFAEYVALFMITFWLGRSSGVHLQYIIAAAAPFVVFGLERIRMVLVIVTLGLVLHLLAWFASPAGRIPADQHVIDSMYTTAAITTVALIAATVWYAFRLVEQARSETDLLLRRILPGRIADRLKAAPERVIADDFATTSVLFGDISGFVALSQRLGAAGVVQLLNEIIREFDQIAAHHGVEKIKTIGDAYMVVAGVPEPVTDPAHRMAAMAFDMLAVIAQTEARTGNALSMRIGIATGPVLAGVIGTTRFSYDVWGPTVNLASRLEASGIPGQIHVCATTRALLEGRLLLAPLDRVELKGFGAVERWRLLAGSDASAVALDTAV